MRLRTSDGIVRSDESRKITGHHGSQNGSLPHLRKLILLGIANLLVAGNVWAQLYAPSQPVVTSVCSNAVSLSWADAMLGQNHKNTKT